MVQRRGGGTGRLRPDLELERGGRRRHVVSLLRPERLQPRHRQLGCERRDNHELCVLPAPLLPSPHLSLGPRLTVPPPHRAPRLVCACAAMFLSAETFDRDISSWNMSSVVDASCASSPRRCSPLRTLPRPPPHHAPASPCPRLVCACAVMFQGAASFNQDVSDWDMGSVKQASCASSPRLSAALARPRPPASPCPRLVCACSYVLPRDRVRAADYLLGLLVTGSNAHRDRN